jgi:ribonuclease Z
MMHSTAKEAAQSAKKAGVKKLILTHYSGRYKNEELGMLLKEAKKEFKDVACAKDFDRFEL